jgi:hypothetical protein
VGGGTLSTAVVTRHDLAASVLLGGAAVLAGWYVTNAPVEGEFRWPIHQIRLGLLVILALAAVALRRAPASMPPTATPIRPRRSPSQRQATCAGRGRAG